MKELLMVFAWLTLIFEATAQDNTLLYNDINYNLNEQTKEASVVSLPKGYQYSGKIVIDSIINNNGSDYTVTTIGNDAFRNCSELVSVQMPSTIKQINGYAFAGTGLKTLRLPIKLEKMGFHAFEDCKNLQSVFFPETLKEISSCAFACTGLDTLRLPINLEKIGIGAFKDCKNLQSVFFPETLKEIRSDVFSGDINLMHLDVPSETVFTLVKEKVTYLPKAHRYLSMASYLIHSCLRRKRKRKRT